ncbi:LPXTG cell wall anchor domain-containing protein [Microbacterium sp. NPDC089698]
MAQTGGDSMLLAGGIAGLLLLSGALTLIVVKRRNSMS